jgi:rare lipoprotein A
MLAKSFVMLLMFYAHGEFGPDVGFADVPSLRLHQTGLASWYGSGIKNDGGLHGGITATGESFDPSKQTCASRNIPLNRVVWIRRLKDPTKVVRCRVNDRGPYGATDDDGNWFVKTSSKEPGEWRGVMDLSRGTAEALGFDFRSGLEEIEIFLVN